VKIGKTHPALRLRFLRGNKYHFFPLWCKPLLLTPRSMYLCHDELFCPSPAHEYTPHPARPPPPPRLRILPSDKQIITPRYEAECTSIIHPVHNLHAHLREDASHGNVRESSKAASAEVRGGALVSAVARMSQNPFSDSAHQF